MIALGKIRQKGENWSAGRADLKELRWVASENRGDENTISMCNHSCCLIIDVDVNEAYSKKF